MVGLNEILDKAWIFLLIIWLLSFPIILIINCRQITRTWDFIRFRYNSKFWALSILNWRYRQKKAHGLSTIDFIIYFNKSYLSQGFHGMWKTLDDEGRNIFVGILSNPRFIEENFGLEKFTFEEHLRILSKWEELMKSYSELDDPSDNVELY